MTDHAPDQIRMATSMLADDLANVARIAIGPNGVMTKVHEEDAGVARAALISTIAEAACKILDGEL